MGMHIQSATFRRYELTVMRRLLVTGEWSYWITKNRSIIVPQTGNFSSADEAKAAAYEQLYEMFLDKNERKHISQEPLVWGSPWPERSRKRGEPLVAKKKKPR